jgi:hypothetical protein
MDLKHFIKGYIYRKQAKSFKTDNYIKRLANLAEIPVVLVVLAKSLRTLQCGVPCATKELLPFPTIMTSITLYARTNARATSDEDVSCQTVSTVFQIFSNDASV